MILQAADSVLVPSLVPAELAICMLQYVLIISNTLGSTASEGSALEPVLALVELTIRMSQLCPDVFDGADPFFLDESTSVVLGVCMT